MEIMKKVWLDVISTLIVAIGCSYVVVKVIWIMLDSFSNPRIYL